MQNCLLLRVIERPFVFSFQVCCEIKENQASKKELKNRYVIGENATTMEKFERQWKQSDAGKV